MKIIRDWVQWLRDYKKGGDIVRRPGWWQQSRLIEETEINIKKKNNCLGLSQWDYLFSLIIRFLTEDLPTNNRQSNNVFPVTYLDP